MLTVCTCQIKLGKINAHTVMASENKYMCEDHTTKELIFLCTLCNKLICNRCKKADHEGHKTKDIGKVALEFRQQSASDKEQLKEHIKRAKQNLDKYNALLEDFETSAKNTEEEIRDRGEAVKTWIDKHVQKKMALVQQFAGNTERRHLTRNIREVEAQLTYLEKRATASESILREDASDHEVAKLSTALWKKATESNNQNCDARNEVPKHTSHIYLHNGNFVKWKQSLRDFIGAPGLAQTNQVSLKTGLALALKLKCSAHPEAQVLGLCVVGDGRVIVAVSCDDPTKGILKLYNEAGALVHEEPIPSPSSCKLTVSSGKLLSLCTLSGTVEVLDSAPVTRFLSESVGTEAKDQQTQARVYSLKKDLPGNNKHQKKKLFPSSRKEQHKVYDLNDTTLKHIFNVCADDPQAIVTNSSGSFFAVIQGSFVPSESAEASPPTGKSTFYDASRSALTVAVFARPDGPGTSTNKTLEPLGPPVSLRVSETDKACHPTDACFYKFDLKQEVLVVADAGNNSLVQVGLKNDDGSLGCKLLGSLMLDCPLLDTPTALTTDTKDRLWIGCRGGKILTLVPEEEVAEGDYLFPKDLNDGESSTYEDDISDEDLYGDACNLKATNPPKENGSSHPPPVTTRVDQGPEPMGVASSPALPGKPPSSDAERNGSALSSSSSSLTSAGQGADDQNKTKKASKTAIQEEASGESDSIAPSESATPAAAVAAPHVENQQAEADGARGEDQQQKAEEGKASRPPAKPARKPALLERLKMFDHHS